MLPASSLHVKSQNILHPSASDMGLTPNLPTRRVAADAAGTTIDSSDTKKGVGAVVKSQEIGTGDGPPAW